MRKILFFLILMTLPVMAHAGAVTGPAYMCISSITGKVCADKTGTNTLKLQGTGATITKVNGKPVLTVPGGGGSGGPVGFVDVTGSPNDNTALSSALGGKVSEAPLNQTPYVRINGTWVTTPQAINNATSATPSDNDKIGYAHDTGWVYSTWAVIKSTIKTAFDSVYHGVTITWAEITGAPTDNAAMATALGAKKDKNSFTSYSANRKTDFDTVTATLPSIAQKAALAGTNGSPSGTNRYVTNSDPRFLTPNGIVKGNGSGAAVSAVSGVDYLAPSGAGGTWVERSIPVPATYAAVVWNGSIYCAIASGGSVITSTDGVTWTARGSIGAYSWSAIAWNGSKFCAVASMTRVTATSPDGITWTQNTLALPPSAPWTGIAGNSSIFVAVAGNGTLASSPDGVTWTVRTAPTTRGWTSVVWTGATFCAVATVSPYAITSPDGVTWTQRTVSTSLALLGLNSVAWNGSVLCAVGEAGLVATSADNGVTWSVQNISAPFAGYTIIPNFTSVAWNGSVFTTVGNAIVASSADNGATWVVRTNVLPRGLSWHTVASNGRNFCALGGDNTTVATTVDFNAGTTGNAAYRDVGTAPGTVAAGDDDRFSNPYGAQSAGKVLAGPASGGAAAPTFRTLTPGEVGALAPTGSGAGLTGMTPKQIGANFTGWNTLTKQVSSSAITAGAIYAADANTLYKSVDDGRSWTTLKTFPNASEFRTVWVAASGALYISAMSSYDAPYMSSSDTGLWRSTDGGATFTRVITLLPQECIWAIDEDASGNIYAGVYHLAAGNNANIYKSADGGVTFTSVYNGESNRHIHGLNVDKASGYIYAMVGDNGYGNTALRSTDNGATWSHILTSMVQMTTVLATPTSRLFGTDKQFVGQMWRTTDDVTATLVLDTFYQNCFFTRRNPVTGNIYTGFKTGTDPATRSSLYMSSDDGLTWRVVKTLENLIPGEGFWFASNFYNNKMIIGYKTNGAFRDGIVLEDNINPASVLVYQNSADDLSLKYAPYGATVNGIPIGPNATIPAATAAVNGTVTISGNQTKVASVGYTNPASNKCLEVDANGNLQIAGTNAACGAGGGSGLSTSLTPAHVYVGNSGGVATDTAISGDVAITNAGVATVITGSTAQAGKVQLTDSTSSTSTTTAATPASVKAAYDLANGKQSPLVAGTDYLPVNNPTATGTLTTPIAAISQTLGANIVTSSFSGWTLGANWTVSSGIASHSAGSTAALTQSATVTVGATYKLSFDVVVTDPSGGGLTPSCGGVSFLALNSTASIVTYFTATATTALSFAPNVPGFIGSLSNVVLQQVTNGTASIGPQITIDKRGYFGIGTSPLAPLHLFANYGSYLATPVIFEREGNGLGGLTVQMDNYSMAQGNSGTGSGLLTRGARGTKLSPADVAAGDRLGFLVFGGYAGGAFRHVAAINALADTGTVSSTSLPTYLQFLTTANGSTTRTEHMRLSGSGGLWFGTGTASDPGAGNVIQNGTNTSSIYGQTYTLNNGSNSLSLMSNGSNAWGVTGWVNAGVLESNSAGGLVFSAYNSTGDILFQTGGSRTLGAKLDRNGVFSAKTFQETVYAPVSGSSFTVDLANGNDQEFSTNANTTITLPAPVAGKSYTVTVKYGGAHTVNWAGGGTLKWSNATVPIATSVSGKYDIYVFKSDATGTITFGSDGGRNF